MLSLALMALTGLFLMWLLILGALGEKGRLFLAQHPLLFLGLHIPVMLVFTYIGGEGLLFGVGNLLAGVAAQLLLQLWGMAKFGLTFTGKRGPSCKLPPRKQMVKQILHKAK